MKIVGYCAMHEYLVDDHKLKSYCSTRQKGKRCRHFYFRIPNHKKALRSQLEGRGVAKGAATSKRRKGRK